MNLRENVSLILGGGGGNAYGISGTGRGICLNMWGRRKITYHQKITKVVVLMTLILVKDWFGYLS